VRSKAPCARAEQTTELRSPHCAFRRWDAAVEGILRH
jgi:hypothetical protein